MDKKTKVVATIGPATSSEKMLTKLVKSGMNVMRLNFSHGDFEEHAEKVENLKKVQKKLKTRVAVLQDLAGPKIRTGEFETERITLKKGATVTLTTKKIVGNAERFFVNYKNLPKELKKGSIVLLDDGRRKLEVLNISGTEIKCKVVIGGDIKGRRGVNLPGAYLKISSVTKKDKEDIAFGLKYNVDFMALSFVRRSSDVVELKNILKKANANIKVVAKIETQEAVDNIDEIIAETDGIMVARGDLAVEVGPENVPVYQKMIVDKCNKAGKSVIVATQMLESMINSPVATRAEISDVANAIYDGADAVMLSEETSLGQHPESAVALMRDVAKKAEAGYPYGQRLRNEFRRSNTHASDGIAERCVVDSITFSAVNTAHDIKAKVVVALTETGSTARMISRYHIKQPIVTITPNEDTYGQVVLSFGCYPALIKPFKYVGQTLDIVKNYVVKNKFARKGDKIVLVAGVPFGNVGGTNTVIVLEV